MKHEFDWIILKQAGGGTKGEWIEYIAVHGGYLYRYRKNEFNQVKCRCDKVLTTWFSKERPIEMS